MRRTFFLLCAGLTIAALRVPCAATEDTRLQKIIQNWEVRLTPVKANIILGEPLWFRWDVACKGIIGSYSIRLQLHPKPGELPDTVHPFVDRTTEAELTKPFDVQEKRSGVGFSTFLVRHDLRHLTGDFHFQHCTPLGQSCDEKEAILSNVITYHVRQPTGVDQELIEFAGGLDVVLSLMGFPVGSTEERAKLNGSSEQKMEVQEAVLARFPKSHYSPYILLNRIQLERWAIVGQVGHASVDLAQAREMVKPRLERIISLSTAFLDQCPEHPLATDALFARTWAETYLDRKPDANVDIARLRKLGSRLASVPIDPEKITWPETSTRWPDFQ